jgi:hypothetical protein
MLLPEEAQTKARNTRRQNHAYLIGVGGVLLRPHDKSRIGIRQVEDVHTRGYTNSSRQVDQLFDFEVKQLQRIEPRFADRL